ncbi:hypothetical protein [Sphingomonas turrisvirgatae]|uniref:Uncharacterized protein n=1 Tax=Sphingomonas turrisvirgatae TaxID=1888892 RepID=A0A1E3LSJ6_9SPHN|nr:hypothetical protein [Sphingomonas turrisvirgatae]ODP36742.1 hypothetical protein BFL28_19685 [Sphingomonas turrisvirgatae]
MTSRSAWRWCALAGLATLTISVMFGRVPGLVACGDTGGAGPIIALELVRSAADVAALFGSEPCTSRLIAAQREALWLDMLGFIPAYLTFLLSAVAALRRASLGLIMALFSAITFAGAFDFIEGLILFKLLGNLPGDQRTFTGLFWTVRPKFALLAASELMIALILWRGAPVAKIAAGVIGAGGVVALVHLLRAPHDPAMMRGHAVAWGALLVTAAIGSVRPAVPGLPERRLMAAAKP